MTTTKTKPKSKKPAISTDDYAWFTCEHGSYRVVKTRFGLYKSVDKEDNNLITSLTEEGIHACTPLHLLAKQPNYDGRYDYVIGKSTPIVDL